MAAGPQQHAPQLPLALCIQPACLEHKYIRHSNSSHIFERPERIRAVLLGFAAALSRLEAADAAGVPAGATNANGQARAGHRSGGNGSDELASMLSSLSIASSTPFLPPSHIHLITPPPPPSSPGQILLHHPALQLAHCPPEEAPFPYLPKTRGAALPSSSYLRDLFKWASEAVETIKATGCEIPDDLGLNPGDLYLGPGSVLAIEGSVQTVCQAVDGVCVAADSESATQQTEPRSATPESLPPFNKAFCAIRPPGHHCGEDAPSGFCYINNVVVGAMHAYIQHDIDRAIIIDFDLHHGNGTQALVMPHNAAAYAEDLAMAAGKPPTDMRGRKGVRRAWKSFYGSVHDIYSYPCEDGDLDLIKDASLSLAAHGQYIENIHLQPYENEDDFYARIYPKYLALLEKALVFLQETDADPERTILFISAGFDACEHEHQGMQRHNRRVPVSFYSRYTRDIASFADKYTLGKVVSVLEGGYGDRALTSAAMGHAIGLLGREGVPAWWTVDELALLERAVKKRRKGKLCALPPDLSSNAHIARTHALLSHFEGSAPPETPAPSVTATPQARMTLRTRRTADPSANDSPIPRRAARTKPMSVNAGCPTAVVQLPTPKPVVEPVVVKTELVPDIASVTAAEDLYPSPNSLASPSSPPGDQQSDAPIILRIPRATPAASPAGSPPRSTPGTVPVLPVAPPMRPPVAASTAPAPSAARSAAPARDPGARDLGARERPTAPLSTASLPLSASAVPPTEAERQPQPAPRLPAPQSIPAGIFFRPQNVQAVVLPPTPVRPQEAPSNARRAPRGSDGTRVPQPNFSADAPRVPSPGPGASRVPPGHVPSLTRVVPFDRASPSPPSFATWPSVSASDPASTAPGAARSRLDPAAAQLAYPLS